MDTVILRVSYERRKLLEAAPLQVEHEPFGSCVLLRCRRQTFRGNLLEDAALARLSRAQHRSHGGGATTSLRLLILPFNRAPYSRKWPFDRTAAKVSNEPIPEVSKSCCVCSQHDNPLHGRRKCVHSLVSQRYAVSQRSVMLSRLLDNDATRIVCSQTDTRSAARHSCRTRKFQMEYASERSRSEILFWVADEFHHARNDDKDCTRPLRGVQGFLGNEDTGGSDRYQNL